MRTIKWSSAFKKDFKRETKGKHGTTIQRDLGVVVQLLIEDAELPSAYCDHPLSGEWKGSRDLHVHPDLVLIYSKPLDAKTKQDLQLLRLERLGSHSELAI